MRKLHDFDFAGFDSASITLSNLIADLTRKIGNENLSGDDIFWIIANDYFHEFGELLEKIEPAIELIASLDSRSSDIAVYRLFADDDLELVASTGHGAGGLYGYMWYNTVFRVCGPDEWDTIERALTKEHLEARKEALIDEWRKLQLAEPNAPLKLAARINRERCMVTRYFQERGLEGRLPDDGNGGNGVVSDNHERDEHIYRECRKGTAYAQIRRDVKNHQGWWSLDTDQGIRQAAMRFAVKHKLPLPEPRRGK